jgi:hypothetical protein
MKTPAEVEDINNVSKYLAADQVAKGTLFGERLNPRLPLQLYMEGKALSWGIANGASGVQQVANYVLALDGSLGLVADAIITMGGGGSVTPVSPPVGTAPDPIDIEITAISSPFSGSISSATLTDFIGYNVEVLRGGIGQNTTNTGGSYFSWNKVTGSFQWFPALSNTEVIRITATI